jgi:hypothetical protein
MTASVTANVAVAAPMPTASEPTAMAVKPVDRRISRPAYRRSRMRSSIGWNEKRSRLASWNTAGLPNSRRASRRASLGATPLARYSSSSSRR